MEHVMKKSKLDRLVLVSIMLVIALIGFTCTAAYHFSRQQPARSAYIDVCENGPVQLTPYFGRESFSVEMGSNESYEFDGSRIDSVVIEPLNDRVQINVNGEIIQLDNREKFVYEPNR